MASGETLGESRPSRTSTSRQNIPLADPASARVREDAAWLGGVQARAILPVKWALLGVTLLFWLWPRNWADPPALVFALFFICASLAAAETWFLLRKRVSPHQMLGFAWVSFVLDLGFVSALTLLDRVYPAAMDGGAQGSEFATFFVLMSLRGFALLRTRVEAVFVAGLITALYLGTAFFQMSATEFPDITALVFRLALVWTVIFLSMVVVDVLHRQREEMLRAQEHLARRESLARIGELAAGVAHEINNPIGVITTYCEYLKRLPDLPYADDIAQIQAEARRCEGIVRQLVDFSNPRVGEFEAIDLPELVRDITSFLELDRNLRVPITVEAEAGLPRILGERNQLKQAFLNCLVNARQILAETKNPDPKIHVRIDRAPDRANRLRAAIHDNGPGLSEEDLARVFDPFFSKRAGGTGLGLSITLRIVEAHEGRIEIENHRAGGAVVTITLPIVES